MHFPRNLSLSLILLATAAAAHADVITFTETINGAQGFLAQNSFPFNAYTLVNSPVTITGIADTSAITRGAQGQYDLILSSATFSVVTGENLVTRSLSTTSNSLPVFLTSRFNTRPLFPVPPSRPIT